MLFETPRVIALGGLSLHRRDTFENYFKLYEKAKQIGDSKLSATAKALKYALVLKLCWSHFDVGDNLGSSHYVYDLTQICHQHLLQPTSATNIVTCLVKLK